MFTVAASSLTPGTLYSYAAYATNSSGTSYSMVDTFTTLSNDANLSALANRLHEPCDTLLPSLVRLAQQFSGHEEFADDVCLVGIDVHNGASPS